MSGFGPISSALFWFPVGCPIMLSSIFKMCLVSLTCLSMLIGAWNRALFNDLLYYFISTLHALFLLFTLCFRCPFLRRVLDCAHDPPSILSKLSHKNSFSTETKSHACGYLQLTTLPTFHTHQSPPFISTEPGHHNTPIPGSYTHGSTCMASNNAWELHQVAKIASLTLNNEDRGVGEACKESYVGGVLCYNFGRHHLYAFGEQI